MNSDVIEFFLENFHEFQASRDIESQYVIWDINAAIYNTPLTNSERSIIQRLYINPPAPPERDHTAKNGFTNGRPPGGTTQSAVGQELGIEKSTLSNIKKAAIEKIANYLSEAYNGIEE
jgi:hypothetical protein